MRLIDLTKTIYHAMPVYPGDPPVDIEPVHHLESHGWRLSRLSLGSHTATHVDAFSHMVADGQTIDNIPPERFIGRAVVVDLEADWPSGLGLFFTEPIDCRQLAKIEAARPGFVGGDITPELEKALLERGIITYTELINLEQIPAGQPFTFIGLPLKIRDGDGSPVRAVALLDKEKEVND